MKILYLGSPRQNMLDYVKATGDQVITTEDRIVPGSDMFNRTDFIVSYGYPRAFVKSGGLRFEFRRPLLKESRITADVVITEEKNE